MEFIKVIYLLFTKSLQYLGTLVQLLVDRLVIPRSQTVSNSHDMLQEVMGEYVGITRSEEGLTTGISKLQNLEQKVAQVKAHGSSQYNAGWHEALDMQSLMVVAQAVARAARVRKESRGAHTRVDYVGEHAEWGNKKLLNFIFFDDSLGLIGAETL